MKGIYDAKRDFDKYAICECEISIPGAQHSEAFG
jgi:hypothetical protein